MHYEHHIPFDLPDDCPLEVGIVYAEPGRPPTHERNWRFDGERLIATDETPTQWLPATGADAVRAYDAARAAEREAEERAEAEARAAEEHERVLAEYGFVGYVSSETPATEAFEGTSIITPSSGIITGWAARGKSALAHEMAHSFATGAPLFGLYDCLVEPSPVLYIQTEVMWPEMERRQAALRERDDIPSTPNLLMLPRDIAAELDFSKPMHRDRVYPSPSRAKVEKIIEDLNVRHLFLDPLYQLVGAADMSDRNMQVPSILGWLDELRARFNLSVWYTEMGDGPRTVEGIAHSKMQRMWVECCIGCERKDVTAHLWSDFTYYVEPKRYRDTYLKRKIALRGKGVGVWEHKAPAASPQVVTEGEPDRAELLDMLCMSVKEKPTLTVRARAEALGISKSTCGRLLTQLKEEQ